MTATAAAATTGAATLRPMRWWDLEAVAALEAVLFPVDAWSVGQFWGELARVPETRWYVVAEDDTGVVGYAGLFAVPPDADVQTVAVAPAAQGRGLGERLVRALADEAIRRGCTRLLLEVRADNAPALRLYERLGFARDGLRRSYYAPGVDAVLMTRSLKERVT